MPENLKPTELLDRRAARAAGAMSGLLGLGGIVANVAYIATQREQSAALTTMAGLKIALMVIVIAAGVQLIRGRTWAQRFLLVVWLGGLVSVVSLAIAVLLWGEPSWWTTWLGRNWSIPGVLGSVGILEVLVIVLLVRASLGGSRLRYATNVALAVAAGLALAIVLNMFAQTDPNYRRVDVETLGRYALSERTKRILDAVDNPIHLTCVYTATYEKDQTADRRARVMELLEEMREHKRTIEIANVVTDTEKAALVERLRVQSGGQADEHLKLLNRFRTEAGKIVTVLKTEQQRWEQTTGTSYLDQWGLAAEVSRLLKAISEEIEKVFDEAKTAMTGRGIVEYARLVEKAKKALSTAQDALEQIVARMEQVAKIAPAVRENRQSALKSADKALTAVRAMSKDIGKVGDEVPHDPARSLEKFAKAADRAGEQMTAAARALSEVAGKEYAPFVRASQAWLVRERQGPRAVLPDGRVVRLSLGRTTVADLYAETDRTITRLKVDAENFRKAAKAEYQVKIIKQLRKTLAELTASLTAARTAAETAMDRLSEVDPPTQALLDNVGGGEAFNAARQPVASLLDAIEKLPELKEGSLAADITGENIILVETAGKAVVVDFETVWPLKIRPLGMGTAEGQEDKKRTFGGDSAITSKILALTTEPFARVLLTHYTPPVPPQMARMIPPADISPNNLTALRRRLEEANFEVEEWNVSEDRPAPKDPNRPEVMMLLPPPFIPPLPYARGGSEISPFGPEHMERIRAAIDGGTPGIFLAKYFLPRQMSYFSPLVDPPYPYGDYLRKEWGIDVRTNFLVVPTVPDDRRAGKFLIAPARFSHMPLSAFSNHPIGRFLQGQRTLWPWLAPVQRTATIPEGVTADPLLTVPASWNTTWATGRFEALVGQFRGDENSFVTPNYEAGDIPAPFDVALAATRTGRDKVKPARIVVLGMGAGMMDGYLDGQIPVMKGEALTLTDPPRTNADVVINSTYWLIGREHYIARGPAQIQPIAMITEGTLWTLKGLCLIGLPVIVFVLGVVVLIVRRG